MITLQDGLALAGVVWVAGSTMAQFRAVRESTRDQGRRIGRLEDKTTALLVLALTCTPEARAVVLRELADVLREARPAP